MYNEELYYHLMEVLCRDKYYWIGHKKSFIVVLTILPMEITGLIGFN